MPTKRRTHDAHAEKPGYKRCYRCDRLRLLCFFHRNKGEWAPFCRDCKSTPPVTMYLGLDRWAKTKKALRVIQSQVMSSEKPHRRHDELPGDHRTASPLQAYQRGFLDARNGSRNPEQMRYKDSTKQELYTMGFWDARAAIPEGENIVTDPATIRYNRAARERKRKAKSL